MKRDTKEITICALAVIAMVVCYFLLSYSGAAAEDLQAAKIGIIIGGAALAAVIVEYVFNKRTK